MKTHNRLFTFSLILLLLPLSCNNIPSEIAVVDMDNPSGSIDLKISDLLDNITIVPLETNDNILLSTAGMSFIVSNLYILARTGDKLLQFDRKGKFIRTLAIRGNGPNEFTNIMNPLVDEKRELLYYGDSRRDVPLVCIDLHTGNFMEFPNPNLSPFSIREIDAQGNIYGYSSTTATRVVGTPSGGIAVGSSSREKSSDSLELLYRYNPADNSTTSFIPQHSVTADDRGRVTFRQGEHISFLFFSYSDTLFTVTGDVLNPKYVVKLKNQMTEMQKGGIALLVPIAGSWGSMISKIDSKVIIGDNSISVIRKIVGYLHLDKNGTVKTAKSITIEQIAKTIDIDDYLIERYEGRGGEIQIDPIPTVSGVWAHYKVEAYNMITFINEALKGNKISASQRKTLEEVAAQIDNDSNPVLIIGKIK